MCNYCTLAEKLDDWGDDLGNWDIDCGEMGLIDGGIKIQPEDGECRYVQWFGCKNTIILGTYLRVGAFSLG